MHLEFIYNTFQKLTKQIKIPIIVSTRLYGFIKYVDNNYAGDFKDWKSVIGYYFYLNNTVISWYNKNQQIVSMSIFESKYIVFNYAIQENI